HLLHHAPGSIGAGAGDHQADHRRGADDKLPFLRRKIGFARHRDSSRFDHGAVRRACNDQIASSKLRYPERGGSLFYAVAVVVAHPHIALSIEITGAAPALLTAEGSQVEII